MFPKHQIVQHCCKHYVECVLQPTLTDVRHYMTGNQGYKIMTQVKEIKDAMDR